MPLPVLTEHLARTKLGDFCRRRIPPEARESVRLELEFADDQVTLIETRPHFQDAAEWTRLPVAGFRFNAASGTWTLHAPAFGTRNSWRRYPAPPSRDLDKLIALLDRDADGTFWG